MPRNAAERITREVIARSKRETASASSAARSKSDIASASNTAGGNGLDELFDIPETARRLGNVSTWTVRAWINQGRIRKTKVGARTMVSASALREFLEECQKKG
jgi:excisionase family DNA binding protein